MKFIRPCSKSPRDGLTPADWIAAHLPDRTNGSDKVTQAEIDAANAKLRETIFTLEYSTGSDNESIDRDLAREYGADRDSPLYLPQKDQ